MHDTRRPRLWGLSGPTGILAVSVFLNFAGFTLIIPVLPFSVARYVPAEFVAPAVSLIIAIYALCAFLAGPMLGALSDHFGRRPVLLLSLLGSAVGFAVFGIGGALWVLILGRIVEGLTAGAISAMYACVADTYPPAERGAVYGLLGAAGGLGFMLGPVLGGLLGGISLAAPLYLATILALGNAAWVYLRLPESRPATTRADKLGLLHLNPLRPLAAALRYGGLRVLFAAAFCFFGAGTLLQSNLAVLLKDHLGFDTAAIGVVLLGVGAMDIVSQGLLSPPLIRRFGERRTATVGLVINAMGFAAIALVAFTAWVPLLIGGMAIFTLGDGLFQPAQNGMIASAAPEGKQGEVQGANQAQQAIARTIGPLVGAALYTMLPAGPYLLGAVIVLGGAVVLLAAGRARQRAGGPSDGLRAG